MLWFTFQLESQYLRYFSHTEWYHNRWMLDNPQHTALRQPSVHDIHLLRSLDRKSNLIHNLRPVDTVRQAYVRKQTGSCPLLRRKCCNKKAILAIYLEIKIIMQIVKAKGTFIIMLDYFWLLISYHSDGFSMPRTKCAKSQRQTFLHAVN